MVDESIRANIRLHKDDPGLQAFFEKYEKLPVDEAGKKIGVTKLIRDAVCFYYGNEWRMFEGALKQNAIEIVKTDEVKAEKKKKVSKSVAMLGSLNF